MRWFIRTVWLSSCRNKGIGMSSKVAKRIARSARGATRFLANLATKKKNSVLKRMAKDLVREEGLILRENEKDIRNARTRNLSSALIDRLTLSHSRINAMAECIQGVAGLPDPVGRITELVRRPNGLVITKVSVPIGVILMIYEARPNVTADCIALSLKSGNSSILRGGSEAINSNIAIFNILSKSAKRCGLPAGSINMVTRTERSIVEDLLKENRYIDLVIPRGGESLINKVASISKIPVIKHYKGICHTYIDRPCKLEMAEKICLNAKVQRPGVCNAMETLLVHKGIAKKFLPSIIKKLSGFGVEIRGCPATREISPSVKRATETDWHTEYLDLILSVKVVSDLDEAIGHIAKYGSQHSDAIVTSNYSNAMKFLREVDSACVYVNASTRFTDGNQFGKGAEIGISTDRLHARGPMGLEELTTYKYIVVGNGQVRK